MMYIAIM